MGMDNKKLLFDKIYSDVFSHLNKPNIDIFLCGGASTSEKKSFRDVLREELKLIDKINVLYPEELFMEILNRKHYNLLQLEELLAENCDYIVIVSESPGSYAELGAFANNENTMKKTIVLSQTKFKNVRSFIKQGPIQHIEDYDKKHVIYYNETNKEKCIDDLLKAIRIHNRNGIIYNYNKNKKDIDLISGQYNYIMLLLYFFVDLEIIDVKNTVKEIFISKGFPSKSFEVVYQSAIRRLFSDGQICKHKENDKSKYKLSSKGYHTACSLIDSIRIDKKSYTLNRIRLDIIDE